MITPIEELRRRNDAYIDNMLQQKSKHSIEYILAATLIFEERRLADPKKQELIKQYPALREEVFHKYKDGMSEEDLMSYLTAKGMSKQDAKEMITNAVIQHQKAVKKDKNKNKNKAILIAVIVAVVYMTIRLCMKTSQ